MRDSLIKVFVVGLLVFLFTQSFQNTAYALLPAGSIDSSFSTLGSLGGYGVEDIAETADGKLIIVGTFKSFGNYPLNGIARLNADGSVDTTFNTGTGFGQNTAGYVKILPDEKIFIAGSFTGYNGDSSARYIARLNSDGSLDSTFSTGTSANFTVTGAIVQTDGKIVIVGGFSSYNGSAVNRIARLNTDGSLDNTFNAGTGANNYITSLVELHDGRIAITGYFTTYNGVSANRFVVLNSDGSINVDFAVGTSANGTVFTVDKMPDNRLIISGIFTTYKGASANRLAVINLDGSLDATINTTIGTGPSSYANSFLFDAGKIYLVGDFSMFNGVASSRIARLNADFTYDNTFTIGTGLANTGSTSLWVGNKIIKDSAGDLIVGGTFSQYNNKLVKSLVKIDTTGAIDSSFNQTYGFNGEVDCMAMDSQGRLLVGGSFTLFNETTVNHIARLNPDGSLDTTFDIGTGFNGEVSHISVDANGKILATGYMTLYNGIAVPYMARLNADGTLDNTFDIGTGPNNHVYTHEHQSDGKILLGGRFSSVDGVAQPYITRLNYDGSIDNTFNVGAGPDYSLDDIAVQSDGKILVAGSFWEFAGFDIIGLARLNPDGSLDNSFLVNTTSYYFDDSVFTIALQDDGKIVVGGDFTYPDSNDSPYIARLNTDGSFDSTFQIGNGFEDTVWKISLQNDQKLLVTGWFYDFNDITSRYFARLNTDGSYDSTFDIGTGISGAVVLESDTFGTDKVYLAGDFYSYNGYTYNNLIALDTRVLFQIDNLGAGFDAKVGTNSVKVGTANGVNSSNQVIELVTETDAPIASLSLDIDTSDSDFSDITILRDATNGKILVSGVNSVNIGELLSVDSIYVPKLNGDNGVYLCPDASSLEDITSDCSSGSFLEYGVDSELSTIEIGGVTYWVISGLAELGDTALMSILVDSGDNGDGNPEPDPEPEESSEDDNTNETVPIATPPVSSETEVEDDNPEDTVDDEPVEDGDGVGELPGENIKEPAPGSEETDSELESSFVEDLKALLNSEVFMSSYLLVSSVGMLLVLPMFPPGGAELGSSIVRGTSSLFATLGFVKNGNLKGYIYDAVTKSPISLVVMRAHDRTGRLIDTSVSNTFGKMELKLPDGKYNLSFQRSNFKFPSALVSGSTDYPIQNIYHGGTVSVIDGKIPELSVPLDPTDYNITAHGMTKVASSFTAKVSLVSRVLFIAGFSYSIYVLAVEQSLFNIFALILYLLVGAYYLYELYYGQGSKVTYKGTPLSNITVLLKKYENGEAIDKRVTDKNGRYKFILTKGSYFIDVEEGIYKLRSLIPVRIDARKPVAYSTKLEVERK